MRPKGTVHLAILDAAHVLADGSKGATMRELARQACVGQDAARYTINAMRRSGALAIVGTRRVPYRNRPVSEYAIPSAGKADAVQPGQALGAVMASWFGTTPACIEDSH